ncbi:MAG TPA: aldehyde dehydrogenase family protein [Candidatus Acidoferrales bacterium]|nr:aldehyde dehydrogenase family protein [Candidatus Acidoferrales bacterium]
MMVTATNTPAREWGFFVHGKWMTEGDTIEVLSPYDGSVVGTVHRATATHAEAAIRAAQHAFETTRKMPSYERQRILRAISDGIAENREEFAALMALEAGKPIRTARAEVDRAIFTFAIAAEEATRIGGEWLPLDLQPSAAGRGGIVRRFPLGPVLGITPFNFPLNLVAHKVAPAIAAGCTMVLKPATKTPLCALRLAQIVESAGLPEGALNVLPMSNGDAERLVTDDQLKLLSFTGSAAVGWSLKSKAGKKKVVLELGGNAAVIVHSDANGDEAAAKCVQGGFSYAGQSCISVQRIFVQREIEPQFTEKLVAGARKLKTGDPLDESTDVGPMIDEDAARRAAEWIDEAVAGGAQLLCGGKRSGALLEPAVLTHTKERMKVQCQELFAPVVVVEPYDDFDEAIRRVNDSAYGLQAGVFTRDARLLFRAFEQIEVGGVIANDMSSFRIDHMPYGGVKDSGMGREGLRYAIEEMTEPRLLVLNLH